MNDEARKIIRAWMKTLPSEASVADLGAYNINGSVKEMIPSAVGYDIIDGPGVDFVVGKNCPVVRYDALTACGSLQCSPNPRLFKREILKLLKPGGKLLIITCSDNCKEQHATSPGTKDCHRWSAGELADFLLPEISVACVVPCTDHPTIAIYGKRA